MTIAGLLLYTKIILLRRHASYFLLEKGFLNPIKRDINIDKKCISREKLKVNSHLRHPHFGPL